MSKRPLAESETKDQPIQKRSKPKAAALGGAIAAFLLDRTDLIDDLVLIILRLAFEEEESKGLIFDRHESGLCHVFADWSMQCFSTFKENVSWTGYEYHMAECKCTQQWCVDNVPHSAKAAEHGRESRRRLFVCGRHGREAEVFPESEEDWDSAVSIDCLMAFEARVVRIPHESIPVPYATYKGTLFNGRVHGLGEATQLAKPLKGHKVVRAIGNFAIGDLHGENCMAELDNGVVCVGRFEHGVLVDGTIYSTSPDEGRVWAHVCSDGRGFGGALKSGSKKIGYFEFEPNLPLVGSGFYRKFLPASNSWVRRRGTFYSNNFEGHEYSESKNVLVRHIRGFVFPDQESMQDPDIQTHMCGPGEYLSCSECRRSFGRIEEIAQFYMKTGKFIELM